MSTSAADCQANFRKLLSKSKTKSTELDKSCRSMDTTIDANVAIDPLWDSLKFEDEQMLDINMIDYLEEFSDTEEGPDDERGDALTPENIFGDRPMISASAQSAAKNTKQNTTPHSASTKQKKQSKKEEPTPYMPQEEAHAYMGPPSGICPPPASSSSYATPQKHNANQMDRNSPTNDYNTSQQQYFSSSSTLDNEYEGQMQRLLASMEKTERTRQMLRMRQQQASSLSTVSASNLTAFVSQLAPTAGAGGGGGAPTSRRGSSISPPRALGRLF